MNCKDRRSGKPNKPTVNEKVFWIFWFESIDHIDARRTPKKRLQNPCADIEPTTR